MNPPWGRHLRESRLHACGKAVDNFEMKSNQIRQLTIAFILPIQLHLPRDFESSCACLVSKLPSFLFLSSLQSHTAAVMLIVI